MHRLLGEREIGLIADALYDRAGRSKTHYRTGEMDPNPIFRDWIDLANLFRDASAASVESTWEQPA